MVKLYSTLAPWYTLITAPKEYEEEATWYAEVLRDHATRPVTSVLELGCGAGANASFLKQWFRMTLVDASLEMLAECRKVNPDLELVHGDMRTFRCNHRFDAVFVHDAVSYMTTAADLKAVVETATVHLQPGGVALFCPDDLRENFRPGLDCGGHDGDDGRAARYLAWSSPGPTADTVTTDYAYLLRRADGTVDIAHDRHTTGRLATKLWRSTLEAAGLAATVLPLAHSEVSAERHHVVVGVKPAQD